MRWVLFVFVAVFGFAQRASAQSSITLDVAPSAIVDAQINGRPVRLEVDPRMPDMLALSSVAAERLRVRRVPFVRGAVSIEGGGSMRGGIARPTIRFGERAARNVAGIFPAPVTTRADGVIGPGSLPYDIVTLRLGADEPTARDIVMPLEDPDIWVASAQVGGETVRLEFDVINDASILNRPAARLFDRTGAIPADGELAERPVILGLSALMQPVRTELTVLGLRLGPTFARTLAPLLGATEEDAFVVEAEGAERRPSLALGRRALLDAGCSSISVDRRARQLTLRCAA